MLSQLHSNDAKEARNKRFLSELYNFPDGIMPIGRLDEKSEGLLLLTTDGKLSDYINRSGVQKEYYVQLDGEITEEAITLLGQGVQIGFHGIKYKTKPSTICRLHNLPTLAEPDKRIRAGRHRPTSWISITITEGKFRQVRKMTAAVGFPTLRLIRVRIGNVLLEDLCPGNVSPVDNLLL